MKRCFENIKRVIGKKKCVLVQKNSTCQMEMMVQAKLIKNSEKTPKTKESNSAQQKDGI